MKAPHGLSASERAAWEHLTQSVTPLEKRGEIRPQMRSQSARLPSASKPLERATKPPKPARPAAGVASGAAPGAAAQSRMSGAKTGLDGQWNRKLASGRVSPDFTLDLHGFSLAEAHRRLESGLAQARAMGARVVLLIAGKPRKADPANRGEARGAIRAQLLDWLAAGPHSDAILAIHPSHRQHGGPGALYLVLRKE